MASEEQVRAVRENLGTLRTELRALYERAEADEDFHAAGERLQRWKQRAVSFLADNVSAEESAKLKQTEKRSWIAGAHLHNLADEIRMYDGFLQALDEETESHPEDVLEVRTPGTADVPRVDVPAAGASNKIFIIHGRDELNLLRLKELLRDRWHLDPIVLVAQAGKGRTIIEKFEQEAQQAVFALALFTPDDVVTLADADYAQARPNAIFELGWFFGRLRRERVCMLIKKGTRIHSDLDGISRIDFEDSVLERVGEIERELVAAQVLR